MKESKSLFVEIKRVLLFSILLLSFVINANAQTPEAFNYQAVIRDNAGNPLPDHIIAIQVKLINGSLNGTIVYSEVFQPTTNSFGLVNLQIGKGTPTSGTFSAIDWSLGPYYLEIDADITGGVNYVQVGVSQLLSVPYALYAQSGVQGSNSWKDSTGIVYSLNKVGIGNSNPTSMLSVNGNNNLPMDTALFEVKDKNGNTVFAVYEEGVRVYVKESPSVGSRAGFSIGGRNPATGATQDLMQITPDSIRFYLTEGIKGARSGFAVGGRSPAKGLNSDIFRVTPDSVRIYVNDNGTKGSRGGFAVGGRNPVKGSPANYLNLTQKNYFIGEDAGKYNTTGLYNSFLGYQAGYSNNTGQANVFLGYTTGYATTSGYENCFIGHTAGHSNTTGYRNVFIGSSVGYSNVAGVQNTFIGNGVGLSNTSGSFNVFVGDGTGSGNTTGEENIFIGETTGPANTTGSSNIFMGSNTGMNNITGSTNIFLGNFSGHSNTTGSNNIYVGWIAGQRNTTGIYNVAIGPQAGFNNVTGSFNTLLGFNAGASNLGSNNVIIGSNAGYNNTGSGSVLIGQKAGVNDTSSNRLYIDNSGAASSTAFIYGEFNNKLLRLNANVGINAAPSASYALYLIGSGYASGGSFTASDARLKKNIRPLDFTMNDLDKLNAVFYDWRSDEFPDMKFQEGTQVGVIAQDVEKVLPELVSTDQKGYKAVDYSKLSVVLLKVVKDQEQIIESQQSQLDILKVRLDEVEKKLK
jgi:hypothetical protein